MSVSCNLDCDLQKASHKNQLNYAVQRSYSLAWDKGIFLFNFWFGKFWLPWKVQRCFYVAAQKKKIRFLASRQLWNYGAHLVLLVSFYLSPLFSLFSLFVLGICLHTSEHDHFCFDMLWFVGLLFRSWEEKASTFNILVQLRPRTNLRMFITTTVHTLVPMVALMLFRRCLPVYTGTKCVLGVRHKLFTSLSFCFCTGIRDGKSMHRQNKGQPLNAFCQGC